MAEETDTEMLARLMKDGFDRMDSQFDEMRKEVATKSDLAATNKRIDILDQKVGRVETKLDTHMQETKDALGGIYRVIGGISGTLTNHEERIKVLEG